MVVEECLDAWIFGLGTPRVNFFDCCSLLRAELFELRLELVESNGALTTIRPLFGVCVYYCST